jgi:hypothetical protein
MTDRSCFYLGSGGHFLPKLVTGVRFSPAASFLLRENPGNNAGIKVEGVLLHDLPQEPGQVLKFAVFFINEKH